MAFIGAALTLGGVGMGILVGCESNAAGPSLEGLDYQVVAVWLMIVALVLFAPLVVAPHNILGVFGFIFVGLLFVAIPSMIFLEEQGYRWCNRISHSAVDEADERATTLAER